MRRALLLLLGLVACEPSLRPQPLPELAAQAKPTPLVVPMLRLLPGETLVWDVHVQGFTIGRAELDVGEHEIHSRFATGGIASAMSRVHHDLTTRLDPRGARPIAAADTLDVDGDRTQSETVFAGSRVTSGARVLAIPGGNVGHTLHSALGVIRAWASPVAHAGYLYIVHAGELFRLDIQQPLVEEWRGRETLRVECRVRGGGAIGSPISISIWLAATPDRVPLRIEVRADDARASAELVGT